MKTEKILELLNTGEIEKLKEELTKEIYEKSLSVDAKKRYSAMKAYIKYNNKQEFSSYAVKKAKGLKEGYSCFCDDHCFVLTKEETGDIPVYEKEFPFSLDNFVIPPEAEVMEIDYAALKTAAIKEGFKLKKAAFKGEVPLRLKIKDGYFDFALFYKAVSIIDDGQPMKIYYTTRKSAIYVTTSIGMSCVLPLRNAKVQKGIDLEDFLIRR